MLPGNFKSHKHHVYNLGKIQVLKAAAIYGANGAGKSNLIKAIEFLQEAVANGGIIKSVNETKFKLNKTNEAKPISFEIEFSINKKIFSYGVSFNAHFVIEEWLYESGITVDDKMIFERKNTKSGKISIDVADKYKKTQKQKLLIELMEDSLLKTGELLIGKSHELKINEILAARHFIKNKIIIIHPESKFANLVPTLTSSKEFKSFANEMLQTFDTGVSELDVETLSFDKYFGDDDEELKKEIIEQVDQGHTILINTDTGGVLAVKEKGKYIIKRVIAKHVGSDGKKISFDLTEESDGTQRLLDFIPAFNKILTDDVSFIIDEIDQSLHPALLKVLVQKIMQEDKTKGQFIFTTHESNLLDLEIFRQDEIWFAEKDKINGNTQLYSLSEFKPRYDLDIRKGYLKGRFGAVPFLASLEDLNWNIQDA
ncbi:AAA family ATPase [Flavobacterium caeni]|nr:ATP-binding protein [Flavobacterium caeni]